MEKKNKKLIIISLISVLLVAALLYFFYFMMGNNINRVNDNSGIDQLGEPASGNVTVEIKNNSFNPPAIAIKKGAVVTWVNRDEQVHTVSSDPHPTHTDLPGLTSNPMKQNQSFSFTFEKKGVFGYHCHYHPTVKGLVVVKE